jgi:hypothetical protein
LEAIERADVKHEPPTEPLVIPRAVKVHRVRLGRVDRDVERDVLAQIDARRGGVAFNLIVRVVGDIDTIIIWNRPLVGSDLLVFGNDWVGRSKCGRGASSSQRDPDHE